MPKAPDPDPSNSWWDFVIRLAVVTGLLTWTYYIVRPFIALILFGAILAVALYPAHAHIERRLGGRRKIAATASVIIVIAILAVPVVLLVDTLVRGASSLVTAYDEGTLGIPPPPDDLESWPIVGKLDEPWQLAHDDLAAAAERYAPPLVQFRRTLVSTATGATWSVLRMTFSLIVMGVFFATADSVDRVVRTLARRVAAGAGDQLVSLSRDTIRSVARGIVGVAFIQSLLAGLGCVVVGVPGAGLWALAVLVLAVAQVGPLPVMIPIAIYVFQTEPTWVGVVFLVWTAFVGLIDNVLKPLLLGRGVEAPMLLVFIGAIGGLLFSGIVGLFIGPVVLVVSFTVVQKWMAPPKNDVAEGDAQDPSEPAPAPMSP
jgi:predicted PurR-regulated permease PerM